MTTNATQMSVSPGKSANSVTSATSTPPIVEPTSGIRSKNAISTASGTANGTPSTLSRM